MVLPTSDRTSHMCVGISQIFFLQTHHILPPIFSWGPSIFPEYSREYSHRNLPHTLVEQNKWSFRGRNGVSECVFARPFREKPLSRAKPTVSTADQLFRHHKHEVKPRSRRNMSGICGKLQCGILETAGICGYSRFGTQERCETPSIFRGIFRNTKLSNTSYIPKDIPEYLRNAKPRAPPTSAGTVGAQSRGAWSEIILPVPKISDDKPSYLEIKD